MPKNIEFNVLPDISISVPIYIQAATKHDVTFVLNGQARVLNVGDTLTIKLDTK